MSVVKVRRSALRASSSSSPGSWIVVSPRESASTFSGEDVAGDDPVAQLGEAGRRHQADPAHPDHADRLSALRHGLRAPSLRFGFLFGIITRADRAMPTIWSLVSDCSRLFEIQ